MPSKNLATIYSKAAPVNRASDCLEVHALREFVYVVVELVRLHSGSNLNMKLVGSWWLEVMNRYWLFCIGTGYSIRSLKGTLASVEYSL